MPKIDTTVGNLVEMVRNGELRLPEMQRRYVWPATRVRDLLDSLYRGYPSGTILVWETALWERKRLDLSVEAVMLQPEWHPLFSDAEREIARRRLAEYGFEPGS